MCYHPVQAGISRFRKKNGQRDIRLHMFSDRVPGYVLNPLYEPIALPCGKCIACRLKYSRQWAMRCMAEAHSHDRNMFITLTFNDAFLPPGGSLDNDYFVKFMKKFRKKCGNGIRFFQCGEYGEKFRRPHHHACIFNFDFDDRVLFKRERGIDLYRSPTLEKLWSDPVSKYPYGYSSIGSLTFDSAAYVARYCTKKIGGKLALSHYKVVRDDESEYMLKPEYATMSRAPGIGRDYFDTYYKEIYVTDSIIARPGLEFTPPRYYDSLYELECPGDYARVKAARVKNALKHSKDATPERLRVREKVHLANAKLLVRGYETGEMYDDSFVCL